VQTSFEENPMMNGADQDWIIGGWFRRLTASLLLVALIDLKPTPVRADEIQQASFISDRQEDDSWPQFRGPDGQGQAGTAKLPLTWSETSNVVWKKLVMGLGYSSPVIQGNRIWMTSTTDGRRSVRAFCFDADSGRQILMTDELFDVTKSGRVLAKYGYASPTPLIDGDRIFVHFGASGTACLKRDGTVIWKQTIPYYQHHGPASSPVMADGTLVIICDGYTHSYYDDHVHEGVDSPQFVVGLDPNTGEVRWKTARDSQHSYSTPLVVQVAGQTQVVCPGGNGVWAYNPKDGAELWNCKYDGYSVVPRPVAAQGLIFVCTGYDNPSMFAIREGATGDCSKTHVAWKSSRSIPLLSSPIVVGDHLYLVNDRGIASCLEIKTGKSMWTHRLGGTFAASPICTGDRLYFPSEEGVTFVLRASPNFEELARNPLDGKLAASPAVHGNRLYLRSEKHLYCIGELEKGPNGSSR
jgi:outer membrane protein assembly factor BamB